MTHSRRGRLTRRRFLALSASAAALAAVPVAAQTRRGGTFISAKTTEAPSLDPIMEQALSRQRLDPLFYNRMVEWGFDGKLEPALAESWTTSADGKTWTFKLRRGVKFHNGRELTSDDVKFTYERILDPKVGSGGRGYLSAIETIEVPDPLTVRIVTKQPSASLLAGMAGGWSAIVSREAVEKGDLRRTAMGTGPFILQEWMPQSHLKARKNPDYWDKSKPVRRCRRDQGHPDEANIIAQLRTGNIHHALLEDNKNYLLVKDDKRLRAQRAPRLGFDMVNINHGRKPYTDVRVRQALCLAVDRTEVLQAAAAGLGSVTGPLTPAMRPWALPVGRVQGVVHAEPGARQEAPGRRRFPRRLQDDAQGDPHVPHHGGRALRSSPLSSRRSAWTCRSSRRSTASGSRPSSSPTSTSTSP